MAVQITGAPIIGAPGPAGKPVVSTKRSFDRIAPYLFLAPFLVSFLLFFAIPSAFSLVLSLFRYRGYGEARFVGLANYTALFDSPSFLRAFANTIFYWLVPLVPLMAIALLLALAVRSPLVRLGRVYKPLLFIPQVMAPVAAAVVWRVVLGNQGVVNSTFDLEVSWLDHPQIGRFSVVLLLLWRSIGWFFVIFLAALTSIPDEVIEAAEVDGANSWQRLRYVILPLLKPIILFAIVIDTIGSLQLFAEPNLLLGSSGGASAPPSGAPIMNQVIQNVAGGQFGLASAAGWIIFAGIGLFSLVQFRLLRERA